MLQPFDFRAPLFGTLPVFVRLSVACEVDITVLHLPLKRAHSFFSSAVAPSGHVVYLSPLKSSLSGSDVIGCLLGRTALAIRAGCHLRLSRHVLVASSVS